VASVLAGVLVAAGVNATWVGGAWFIILFLNFLIGEYELNVKVILIALLCVALLLLWLHLLGWVGDFFDMFRKIVINVNATAYFLVAFLGLAAVGISWIRGLFYYVALTPNYMNIQEGPTETGEHIGHEDYNSRVNTRDFLERLMGFGRVIIIFRDKKREPMTLLVWGIKEKAAVLEAIRGTISVEQRVREAEDTPGPSGGPTDEPPSAEEPGGEKF
jgi:hypothetical protein